MDHIKLILEIIAKLEINCYKRQKQIKTYNNKTNNYKSYLHKIQQ